MMIRGHHAQSLFQDEPMARSGMKRTSCVTRYRVHQVAAQGQTVLPASLVQCLACEDNDHRPGIGLYPWPQSTDGMYEDKEIYPPRLGDPAIYEAHPQFLKDSINRQRFFWGYDTPEKYQTNVRAYFRMISGIDNGVARVLAALKRRASRRTPSWCIPETRILPWRPRLPGEMVALRGVAARADGDL